MTITYIEIEDGTCWPVICNAVDSRLDSIEWRLRHAPKTITDHEMIKLASVVNAYKTLTTASYGAKKLPMIRRALK